MQFINSAVLTKGTSIFLLLSIIGITTAVPHPKLID